MPFRPGPKLLKGEKLFQDVGQLAISFLSSAINLSCAVSNNLSLSSPRDWRRDMLDKGGTGGGIRGGGEGFEFEGGGKSVVERHFFARNTSVVRT